MNKILRQNNGKFGESYLKAEVIKSVEHNIIKMTINVKIIVDSFN
jgi:hypothetical protein